MNIYPRYYTYIILFHGDVEEQGPILKISDIVELKKVNKGRMHLFDDYLISILPAVEYCLHMPRTELDTYDNDVEVLDKAYDVSHNIIVMPDNVFSLMCNIPGISLIIYVDDCYDEIIKIVKRCTSELGSVPVSELSQELLESHWNRLFENRNIRDTNKLIDIEKQYMLKEEKQVALSVIFIARQYNNTEDVYNVVFNSEDMFETCANLVWKQYLHQATLMKCNNLCVDNEQQFRKVFIENRKAIEKTLQINVVITMPGIPKNQMNYGGLSQEIPAEEKKVIRLLGIHRAIAKHAVLIELPVMGIELFHILNNLEINCMQRTNNKYIKRSLREIGKMIEKKMTQEQLWAISRAKHITIFSDFPMGLAIFENADASLQCYKEISYRPLSPLTRSFQNEMIKHNQVYYGNKCKIAFAECIIDDEQNWCIRDCTNQIIQVVENLNKENNKMQVVYEETLTISSLKAFIKKNEDADILHISAHGCYNRRSNMAGLMVGNEFWMAEENDFSVPAVVVLSACHVSPRGSGTVNVADLFIRAGAEAVLGTFVPVDARRNTVLLTRFYTYISEAQKGSTQYKTVSEAWSGVVATNAINEMISMSERFKTWIMGTNKNGKSRFLDFTMERSVGRLHGPTIYSDTINIIKEMLYEEGLDGKFADILDQENYYPESFFYQWIGFPENIFLYNEVFALTE